MPAGKHSSHCWLLTSDNRHKRTHDRADGGEGVLVLSAEEEDELSGEDHLGSLEEASPTSESSYLPSSLNGMANGSNMSSTMATGGMNHSNAFNSLQTLSMPMQMSQPTGAMM